VTLEPELCVGAVVVRDGRLLLIERGRGVAVGSWSIPGGRVDPGETLEQAVERELAEETGLRGRAGEVVGWVERTGPDYRFLIADLWVDVPSTGGSGVAADDAAALAWVPIDEVAAYPGLVEGLAEFLTEHGVVPRA
jgi:ADP-ribose pyrophosphatase YjhB (NUDIX family)